MTSLLASEFRRFRSRRLVKVLLLLEIVAIVVAGVIVYLTQEYELSSFPDVLKGSSLVLLSVAWMLGASAMAGNRRLCGNSMGNGEWRKAWRGAPDSPFAPGLWDLGASPILLPAPTFPTLKNGRSNRKGPWHDDTGLVPFSRDRKKRRHRAART